MTRLSPVAPDFTATSERPTLPSFASLQLPDIRSRRPSMDSTTSSPSAHVSDATNANKLLPPIPLDFNRNWARPRQTSVSSESSDSSTTSTSTVSTRPPSSRRTYFGIHNQRVFEQFKRVHPSYDPARHKLVLVDRYDNADCMLLYPFEHMDELAKRKREFIKRSTGVQLVCPVFVFGRVARMLRNPKWRSFHPARVYPYRIVARDPADVIAYRMRMARLKMRLAAGVRKTQ
ncbi:hypothetical protein BV20DRAFT_970239 [Pilatotrama ljubarskyi]|nr:hypothetical protein BV20DRAFT_970239 [Pilatotrama ljubarskyi]